MWRNVVLALSNIVALWPFVLLMDKGYKIEAALTFAAMTASFTFHAIERDLHNLHGIREIAPFHELSVLYWDRVLAVTLFIFIARIWWKKGRPTIPWVGMLGVSLTILSELGKYGILQGNDAFWWNREVYPILHSMWHVCVFYDIVRTLESKKKRSD